MNKTLPSCDITGLLLAWNGGDGKALEALVPLIYDELRRMARRYMTGEREDHTLQASALVNEAYLKLVDSSRVQWKNRAHFFAVSAQLMRRILVDFARKKRNQKRGGPMRTLPFDENLVVSKDRAKDIVALDDALNALAVSHERASRVVELRYFVGMSTEETAEVLQISTDTVLRDWRFGKSWLLRELRRTEQE
jgi:RNA polymerase sigma factor (TIGR02999 family)